MVRFRGPTAPTSARAWASVLVWPVMICRQGPRVAGGAPTRRRRRRAGDPRRGRARRVATRHLERRPPPRHPRAGSRRSPPPRRAAHVRLDRPAFAHGPTSSAPPAWLPTDRQVQRSPPSGHHGSVTAAGGQLMSMHFATVWETIADAIPDEVALVHGDVRRTWREYDERAARLAGALDRGRARARLQDRHLPLQRQRVPRDAVRRLQAARRAGERELPVPRRRAVVPARQRRRRGHRVPRQPGRSGGEGRPSAPEAEAAGGGRRRRCARPGRHR